MIKFTFALLNSKQRLNFFLLLIFAVIVACLELLGIFSIFPFLSVISDPEIIKNNEYLFAFYNFFEFKNNNSFIQFLGMSVIFLFLIRGIFAISLTALKIIFTRYFHRDLSFRLYKHYMDLKYLEFKKKKTASASEILVNETLYVSNSISDLVTFITELILIFLIFSALMIIDWQITLFSLAMLLFLGLFTIPITKSLTQIGIKRAEKQLNIYNIVNESLNVFKGIKILSVKEFFQNKFIFQLKDFAKNQINYIILAEVPKYFIEITAVIFIMTLILILNSDGSSSSSWVPIISTLALSFYRLLPSINRLISSYNQLKYNKRASNLIIEELSGETENLASEKISFKRKVEFKNISVSFDSSKILKKVNLSIKKGEKIALIGPSGSGKTTFLDIFMGLIRPDDGIIEIDGQYLNKKKIKDWRSKIGYLPQENYLINGTVAENISFGREVNTTKISESIKSSNLSSDPYFNISQNKKIGELGNTLSGGQKQRLMIARLAYGNPEILILDEPTSALDLENEEKIMSEVFKSFKEKTIIVVSHRDEAIKGCDRTIKIENGLIEEVQSN